MLYTILALIVLVLLLIFVVVWVKRKSQQLLQHGVQGVQDILQNFRPRFPNFNLGLWRPNSEPPKERRIILLGKTGKGKSATGNSILGRPAFVSKMSGGSVTTRCKKDSESRFDLDLTVVDTPGLFDTGRDFVDIALGLFDCIHLSTPGPHAFVMVLDKSRFTDEENEAVTLLRAIFGETFLEYTIILFTHKDEMVRQNITPKTFINTNNNLSALIEACGNRYLAFNNFADGQQNELQVKQLLEKINNMTDNGRKYCNTEAWKIHERVLRDKAHIFENRRNTLEQCTQYLEEVKIELKKMKAEERRRFVTQMVTGVAVAGGATAVCGLTATAPATLAYVAGMILSKRRI